MYLVSSILGGSDIEEAMSKARQLHTLRQQNGHHFDFPAFLAQIAEPRSLPEATQTIDIKALPSDNHD